MHAVRKGQFPYAICYPESPTTFMYIYELKEISKIAQNVSVNERVCAMHVPFGSIASYTDFMSTKHGLLYTYIATSLLAFQCTFIVRIDPLAPNILNFLHNVFAIRITPEAKISYWPSFTN